MKIYLSLIIAATLTLASCNKQKFTDFKYQANGVVINCENKELNALINEALFSFEDDIYTYFSNKFEKQGLEYAYSNFISLSLNNQIDFTKIASPHTLKIFEALKQYDIWDTKNPVSNLSYKSPFFECIALNIKDPNLHTTLIALVSTDCMTPKLYGTALLNQYNKVTSDKYLAAYIAFDLYYAKLFKNELNPTKEKLSKEENVYLNDM